MVSTGYTAERPFPFEKKKKLAIAAGVPEDRFVEVKSPYVSNEVTKNFDKEKDKLVFGVSEKDADRFSYTKKDGSPGYFQKWSEGMKLLPFKQHAYIFITPMIEFKVAGETVESASKIRKMYKEADSKKKKQILKDLYPNADINDIKELFDEVLNEVYMPKKYKAGLSKSTASKRKRFWVKLGKYPYSKDEYEKAEKVPGDAKSKTRKSKYTIKYNRLFESKKSITALKKKAKKTGIPYGILKQVYNRGMAAWVTGHRPGASQSAWAFARVNSFVTKGKTWRTADKDLAKKARKYLKESDDFQVQKFRGTFGLIDPKGNQYYPREDGDVYHRHLLKYTPAHNRNKTIEELEKAGWIKWFKQGDEMYFQTYRETIIPRQVYSIVEICKELSGMYDLNEFHFEYRERYIFARSLSDFRRFLNEYFVNVQEAEDFTVSHSLIGLINPTGKQINATDERSHNELLSKVDGDISMLEALKRGYIRWFVERSTTSLIFSTLKKPSKKQIETIKIVMRQLRSLDIEDYYLEFQDKSKYNSVDSSSSSEFISKLSAIHEELEEAEDFDVSKYRSVFGLIDPSAKEYYPGEDEELHQDILDNQTKDKLDLLDAKKLGWITWYIGRVWKSPNNFHINFHTKRSMTESQLKVVLKIANEVSKYQNIVEFSFDGLNKSGDYIPLTADNYMLFKRQLIDSNK